MALEKPCHIRDVGFLEYKKARKLQNMLADLRHNDQIPDTLLLLEHPPTYTLGYKSCAHHFFVPGQWISDGRVAVHQADRGGAITFHGPGQLVGYPVMKLKKGKKGVVHFIRSLERMLIKVLAPFGVHGYQLNDKSTKRAVTGVWVNEQKIAAIGIKMDGNMVTNHGFALNINTDLSYFKKIIPCGIKDKEVTSLAHHIGRSITMSQVKKRVTKAFMDEFGFSHLYQDKPIWKTPE